MFWLISLILQVLLFFSVTSAKPTCSSIEIDFLVLLGASIISLTATPVSTAQLQPSSAADWATLDDCNVTILDKVTVQVWLSSRWNGNFYAAGGSAWRQVFFSFGETGYEGYAAATTNGSYSSPSMSSNPEPSAQISSGNVNLYILQN